MEDDEIARYLSALEREDCYRVDATLKESPHELTQRVFFVGANGAEQGPYVRKFIHRESGMGSAYERIYEAQQAGKRFKHIPLVQECYRHDDFLVVVMEFVNGETLQDLVYRRDPSVQLAVDVFPQLCDAVTELHEAFDPPLIHRDLKPSNVMLAGGSLTIIDFGIAREFKQGAESDTTQFGTRAFAPPEQFGFGQTTVRSDVYALGMLLYYCLTEKIPTAQARDMKFAVANVPERLRPVLVRATALDPTERYARAAEMKSAFIEAAWQPEPAAKAGGNAQAGSATQARFDARPGRRAEHPDMADGKQAAQPVAPAAGRTTRKPKLGVWNMIVIFYTAFVVISCIIIAASPSRFDADYPAVTRILAYGIAEPLLFAALGFACLRKGPIRERSRLLRNVQAWHGWVLFAVIFLFSFILFGIAGAAVGK